MMMKSAAVLITILSSAGANVLPSSLANKYPIVLMPGFLGNESSL